MLSVATEMLLFQRLSLLSTKADALSFHKGKNNLLLVKLYHAAKVKNKGCGKKESFFGSWFCCFFWLAGMSFPFQASLPNVIVG